MKQHTVMTPYMVGEVHFYSTEIAGELVLFDTGPPTPAAIAELEQSVDLKRLRHLFVTHCHIDHDGLASYIEEHSDAEIHFPKRDVLRLQRKEEWLAGLESLLLDAGFDGAFCRSLEGKFQAFHPCPIRFDAAEECEAAGRLGLSVINCPGHSQSDLVYVVEGCAVTGDILLRDVFQSPQLCPDVTDPGRRFDNYRAYCETIPKLAALKGLTILPAHKYSVNDVEETLLFYVGKLLERAGQVRRYAEVEKASEVVKAIFGGTIVDSVIAYIKASEIYLMRDFLADPAPLKHALEQVGLFDKVAEQYRRALS